MYTRLCVLLPVLLMASCDDSGSTPTQPTGSGVATSIAVTLAPLVKVGDTAQATAVATLNSGDTRTLSTGWRSDVPAVATVTDAGLVTGMANGVATISVTFGAVQGTRSLRVVPNYHGLWTGSYRVDSCTPFPSSAYNHFCVGYSPGTTFSLSMTFSQNGEVMNGQFVAGGLVSTGFASTLNGDGSAQVRASNITNPYQYDFNWLVTAATAGQLSGAVHIRRTGSSGLIGGADIEATIVSLAR